jgi:hypothetical protein
MATPAINNMHYEAHPTVFSGARGAYDCVADPHVQGITTMVILESMSQARAHWGSDETDRLQLRDHRWQHGRSRRRVNQLGRCTRVLGSADAVELGRCELRTRRHRTECGISSCCMRATEAFTSYLRLCRPA